ncbi:MAG: hypothetical protein IPG76_21765 [Acidobacteria bacterium]|nr:hypothetical protein [Acidobacteriota bacterium]
MTHPVRTFNLISELLRTIADMISDGGSRRAGNTGYSGASETFADAAQENITSTQDGLTKVPNITAVGERAISDASEAARS